MKRGRAFWFLLGCGGAEQLAISNVQLAIGGGVGVVRGIRGIGGIGVVGIVRVVGIVGV